MIVDVFKPKGKFFLEHYNKDGVFLGKYELDNGVTDEGVNFNFDVFFNSGSQATVWYIGLIDNASFTTGLAPGDTLASHTGWIENTNYSGNRKTWTSGAAAGRNVINSSSVDFTMSATVTIKGLFITNVDTGSSGKLWSTATFGSSIPLSSTDVLKVVYSLSA